MGTAKVRITQVRARQIDAIKSRARSEHFAKVKTAEVDRVIPRTLGGSENEFVFWVRHLKTHLPPNDKGDPAAAKNLWFENTLDPPLGLTDVLSVLSVLCVCIPVTITLRDRGWIEFSDSSVNPALG